MRGFLRMLVVVACVMIAAAANAADLSAINKATKAIGKRNAELSAALEKGDAAAIAALYTEKAELSPPKQARAVGRAAVQEAWTGFAEVMKGLQLSTREVELHDKTAIESGDYVALGAAKEVIERGKYMVIWKNVGGTWFLHRDIWNSTP